MWRGLGVGFVDAQHEAAAVEALDALLEHVEVGLFVVVVVVKVAQLDLLLLLLQDEVLLSLLLLLLPR